MRKDKSYLEGIIDLEIDQNAYNLEYFIGDDKIVFLPKLAGDLYTQEEIDSIGCEVSFKDFGSFTELIGIVSDIDNNLRKL